MKDITSNKETVEWLGTTYRTILTPEESNGSMSIVDSVSPAGFGPPRHIHHKEDEIFVVLSGECEFWLEGEKFYRGPGETAFIPRGKEHTFRIAGDQPCRHLVILTPGGFEGFFHAMAEGQFRIPEDMGSINGQAEQFNMTFTGPPLEA
jgi:quercetin dioxygenase-like cupin family protein